MSFPKEIFFSKCTVHGETFPSEDMSIHLNKNEHGYAVCHIVHSHIEVEKPNNREVEK